MLCLVVCWWCLDVLVCGSMYVVECVSMCQYVIVCVSVCCLRCVVGCVSVGVDALAVARW